MLKYRDQLQIGVVGMYQAGKTVFLTSVLNHLLQHNAARLPVGDGRLELHCVADDLPTSFPPFPYQRYRNWLGHGQWPEKTLAASAYRCQLVASSQPNRIIDLTWYDMPGERLADAPIATRDFDRWSDFMLDAFQHDQYHPIAADYLRRLQAGPIDESDLLSSYRRTMAGFILGYLPLVSPSTFLIDAQGKYLHGESIEEMIQNSVSGTSREEQFAPLSAEARQANPDLAARFRRFYNAYRSLQVLPYFNELRRCQGIVVLVDPTTLLAGGVGIYNGNQWIVQQLIRYLDPGIDGLNTWGDWLAKTVTRGRIGLGHILRAGSGGLLDPGQVERMAIVGTKADKVHRNDCENLVSLLREMTTHLVGGCQRLKRLKLQYSICAAVNSTASLDDYPWLEARSTNGSGDTCRYKPSSVPSEWPEIWKAGEFSFPTIAPWMPAKNTPPRHIELDRVCGFLLGLNK